MVPSVPSRLEWLDAELALIDEQGLRRRLRTVNGVQSRVIDLDGRSVLNFSSNNYLGLADHDDIRRAAASVLSSSGIGSGSSRLIVGNMAEHEALEAELAAFHQTEAALIFNSGYQANIGVLQALAGPEDEVFSDALNHASIIDGCRLSRAKVSIYRHADANHLADLLAASTARRKLVVSDALFSMDGDRAPITALVDLCARFGAALVVDEAHAVGVLGPSGRGLCAEAGVTPDVLIGTMGKAFGVFGAYAAGDRRLIDYLLNRSRSFIFTTALPAMVISACRSALRILSGPQGDELRGSLRSRVTQLRAGLGSSSETQIQPLVLGDERRTMGVAESLLELGIYAQGIRPPTVPKGESRLRIAVMATHRPEDVARLVDGLGEFHVERS
jgi:8-amino-7-oxononanoate synthase